MFMAPIALETDPLYKVLIVGIKETCCDSLGLQNPEKDCRRPDCPSSSTGGRGGQRCAPSIFLQLVCLVSPKFSFSFQNKMKDQGFHSEI